MKRQICSPPSLAGARWPSSMNSNLSRGQSDHGRRQDGEDHHEPAAAVTISTPLPTPSPQHDTPATVRLSLWNFPLSVVF